MKLKLVRSLPLSGTFIALWHYDDQLWCHNLRWEGSKLEVYEHDSDEWIAFHNDSHAINNGNGTDVCFLVEKIEEVKTEKDGPEAEA